MNMTNKNTRVNTTVNNIHLLHMALTAVLTVIWIGFCHTGPISLCVDLYVLLWARWGGPDGIEA